MANRDAELTAGRLCRPRRAHEETITADERDIVARALMARQQNRSTPGPAQIIYGLAKARGFQGQAPAMRQAVSRGAPAPQGIDLAKLADMDDGQYLAWKRSLSPPSTRNLQACSAHLDSAHHQNEDTNQCQPNNEPLLKTCSASR